MSTPPRRGSSFRPPSPSRRGRPRKKRKRTGATKSGIAFFIRIFFLYIDFEEGSAVWLFSIGQRGVQVVCRLSKHSAAPKYLYELLSLLYRCYTTALRGNIYMYCVCFRKQEKTISQSPYPRTMSVVTMLIEKAKTDLFLQKSNDFYIQVRPPPDALRPSPGAAGRAREATTSTAAATTTTGPRLRPGGGGHRSLPRRQGSWTGEGNAGDSNLFSNLYFSFAGIRLH